MSEHGTRKLPVLSSDEVMQNSVAPDEVKAIKILIADTNLLKLFDTWTTHVSWYYSDTRNMIRRQRLVVHELSKYDIIAAVYGIVEWNISLICAFARLICIGKHDLVPMAFRHILGDARC